MHFSPDAGESLGGAQATGPADGLEFAGKAFAVRHLSIRSRYARGFRFGPPRNQQSDRISTKGRDPAEPEALERDPE